MMCVCLCECVCVCGRTRSVLWNNKFQPFLLQHFPPSPQAGCSHFLFLPPSSCLVRQSPVQMYSALSPQLCTGKLIYKKFINGLPCPPALVEISQWGALETDWREGEKVRSGYLFPWPSLCRVTLGQWCPLSKALSSPHDSPLCMTLSFWVPGSTPYPPFLGLGLIPAVFSSSQSAALTLVASPQLCK